VNLQSQKPHKTFIPTTDMDSFNTLDYFSTILAFGQSEERVNSTPEVDFLIDSQQQSELGPPTTFCVIA
jgi:hypothetical protein